MFMLRKAGFTLIELMIAIALGMMVVMTAMSALRTAAQATTIANRLSLDNAVMRAGVRIARDEVDFWIGLDDPDDDRNQRLRPTGSYTVRAHGMNDLHYDHAPSPFTDMSTRWGGTLGNAESDRGYDPRDSAWAVGNPRTWFRGNPAEKTFRDKPSDLRFGRYGIFSNRSTTLSKYCEFDPRDAQGNVLPSANPPPPKVGYGQVQVPHTWLFNQLPLLYSMGHYAVLDYLPSNALIAWMEPYETMGTKKTHSSGGYVIMHRLTDGWQGQAIGRGRATGLGGIGLPDMRVPTIAPASLADKLRQSYPMNAYEGGGGANKAQWAFDNETAYPNAYMTSGITAPASWPSLTVRVHRYVYGGRFVNWARVTKTDPLTGEEIEMSFNAIGTTLRGARQQRRAGGGWAYWDNAANARNDDTLDGPALPGDVVVASPVASQWHGAVASP